MNKKEIEALALEAANIIKNEKDLEDFIHIMTKATITSAKTEIHTKLVDNIGDNNQARSTIQIENTPQKEIKENLEQKQLNRRSQDPASIDHKVLCLYA